MNPHMDMAQAHMGDPALHRQRQAAGLLHDYNERFTDLEVEKFREAFTFFDRNGDGTMSAKDVGLAMRSMGALINQKEIDLLVLKYDPDRTQKIHLEDYISMMAEVVTKPDDEDKIRTAFSAFDKQENGMLDIEEMKHVLTKVGDPLKPEEVTNFVSILDSYGDGHARMNDLLALLLPQSNKDIYAKSVITNEMVDRSQMSYGNA